MVAITVIVVLIMMFWILHPVGLIVGTLALLAWAMGRFRK